MCELSFVSRGMEGVKLKTNALRFAALLRNFATAPGVTKTARYLNVQHFLKI